MSDKQTPIIEADAVEDVRENEQTTADKAQTPPKRKSRLKLHLWLMLILGAGTWAFWTFSPAAIPWKEKLAVYFPQLQPHTSADIMQPDTVVTTELTEQADTPPPSDDENQAHTTQADDTEPAATSESVFEPMPEIPAAADVSPQQDAYSQALSGLQQQIATLQDSLAILQQQQLDIAHQQVASLMYFYLQTAASAQHNFSDRAKAWQSIAMLPLLDDNKRDIAKQAAKALQQLQTDIEDINANINAALGELAAQLHPQDLADVADTVQSLDAYANTDTLTTWLDWLKSQFKLTKVETNAVKLGDDPYADIKRLMNQLHQFKQHLNRGEWSALDAQTLLYQLEQRGINLNFDAEYVDTLRDTDQTWRNEAKSWMEMALL